MEATSAYLCTLYPMSDSCFHQSVLKSFLKMLLLIHFLPLEFITNYKSTSLKIIVKRNSKVIGTRVCIFVFVWS